MNFDFLVEMAWKSALISGAALAVAAALRFRPAGERSAILRTAVAVILALPLIALLLPALPIVTETVRESAPALPVTLPPVDPGLLAMSAPADLPASGAWDDPTPILEWLWLGGAAMIVLRLLAGLFTLRRWTRSATPPDSAQWSEALDRARAAADHDGPVRLLVGDASSPVSWGWHRPVILLDRDTARTPCEADAVLAHEIAHIVRRDWAMLILARLAVAAFWFNPLLWLLERRLIAEAEEAADARALASVEPETYAQTLLSCARQTSAPRLPVTAMADKSLGRRVKTILARRLRVGAPEPRHVRMAMILCALVAAPIAALKPVVATVYAQAAPQPIQPMQPAQPDAAMAPPAAPTVGSDEADAPAAPEPPAAPDAPPAPPAPPAPMAMAAIAPPAPPVPPAPPRARHGDWTGVDGQQLSEEVNRAVRESLAANQEALREAARAGEEVRRELTPERMAEIRRAGDQARIAAMRELTPERMAEIRRAGEQARIAAMHELTPERMAEIRRIGEQARREALRGLAEGSVGMEAGARGMETGARQMDETAEKLRSPQYRAEQIAQAARQGRTVTDAELVAAIPKLHDGARKLREGAARLRDQGVRMRHGG
ncbi:MAG TPA: M56 family metallopeptidase [Allosphingosinicella sp.]|nr:M56 family metallopeptidase [Allosphingosinicella sp.]